MTKQTLKFGNVVIDKKRSYASQQGIPLNLLDTNKIVVSDKFKYSDYGSKYFIGYLHDNDIITCLCIILPQMSGYINYSDNGGKNMSFKIEDASVLLKYNEIWNKIKK